MKTRGLLVLLLILAALIAATSAFQSASVPYASFAGTGQNVVVVAKEDYVFAKVLIEVQPLANESGVLVQGPSTPPTVTFPNGTSRTVTAAATFVLTIPNSAAIPFQAYSASGEGFSISPSSPVSVQFLSAVNSTVPAYYQGIPGIHVFLYQFSGDATISVQVWGVSL
jgi:hypothetical protein